MTKKIIAATTLALATVAAAAVVGLAAQDSDGAASASSRETGTVKLVKSAGEKKVEVIK
ncbi:hypothetical protein [Streptomyces sp. NPDC058579]|uniref:hypothetical protein n=1 Tax=Streptomyces sp. NPDC058579 TaxID=3346548 RepID=UPI003664AE9C